MRRTGPELLDDLAGPKLRRIETGDRLQTEVSADAQHTRGDRVLKRDGNEVRPVWRELTGLLTCTFDGLLGAEAILRVLHKAQQSAIGNTLRVEHEIGGPGRRYGWLGRFGRWSVAGHGIYSEEEIAFAFPNVFTRKQNHEPSGTDGRCRRIARR